MKNDNYEDVMFVYFAQWKDGTLVKDNGTVVVGLTREEVEAYRKRFIEPDGSVPEVFQFPVSALMVGGDASVL